jgi:hypothetical protein
MSDMDSDAALRLAAFAHVRQLLELRDALTASDLALGDSNASRVGVIDAAAFECSLLQDVATDGVREAS